MSRVHCAVLNARPDHFWLTCSQRYGGHGERETPGLIPNPEAKPLSADGTALETGWESRTPPDNHSRRAPSNAGGPFGVSCTKRRCEVARSVVRGVRIPVGPSSRRGIGGS